MNKPVSRKCVQTHQLKQRPRWLQFHVNSVSIIGRRRERARRTVALDHRAHRSPTETWRVGRGRKENVRKGRWALRMWGIPCLRGRSCPSLPSPAPSLWASLLPRLPGDVPPPPRDLSPPHPRPPSHIHCHQPAFHFYLCSSFKL